MRVDATLNRDEAGMTAVIEFLSSFALFLMILTAFLSLAQLQMGSNDPGVDLLDSAAVNGLDRLTSNEGWFVPEIDGELDYENSTSEWHLKSASELHNGRVQPGLLTDGKLDFTKVAALKNVTEIGLVEGLGLASENSLFLSIQITESDTRDGEYLFNDGTPRYSARSSSSSYRSFHQGGEEITVILEVHEGGIRSPVLHVTEVMARPSNSGPEWVEIYNPNQFAQSLRGFSLTHVTSSSSVNALLTDGVMTGQSTALLTGDATSQEAGNATEVIDMSQYGLLGVGSINSLADGSATLYLRFTYEGESSPGQVQRIEWGGDTGNFMTLGDSLEWDGSDMFDSNAWSVQSSPSPGN